jgi:hypothetical protein
VGTNVTDKKGKEPILYIANRLHLLRMRFYNDEFSTSTYPEEGLLLCHGLLNSCILVEY